MHDVLKVSVGSPVLQLVELVGLKAKVTPEGGVYAGPAVVEVPAALTRLQVTVPETVSVQLTE